MSIILKLTQFAEYRPARMVEHVFGVMREEDAFLAKMGFANIFFFLLKGLEKDC